MFERRRERGKKEKKGRTGGLEKREKREEGKIMLLSSGQNKTKKGGEGGVV